jgi:hypothetical protein
MSSEVASQAVALYEGLEASLNISDQRQEISSTSLGMTEQIASYASFRSREDQSVLEDLGPARR